MPEKISLFRGTGDNLSSNIVSIFLVPDTGKRYIITTENAVDPHGLTVLHVSEIVDDALVKISNDEEWSTIKTIMRAIISNNVGSFQYLPLIEKAKAEGQYSRDISVSSSASKQMIDNYIAADKADVVVDEVQKVEEQKEQPANSIFPANNVKPTEENEVSPGIADVGSTSPPQVPPQPSAPAQTAVIATPVVTEQTVTAALPEDTKETAATPGPAVSTDQVEAAIQGVGSPTEVTQQPFMAAQAPMAQPVAQPLSNTQQIPVVQPQMYQGMDMSGMNPQQMYVDQGVSAQMSTFGVTSGYNTIPPMENMYYRNDPMLEQVVLQAQELMNETIRNIVYLIYDKTKQIPSPQQIQQMYPSPMMNTTLYAQPMMQPYPQQVQPMVIQVPNDIQ